MNVIKFTVEIDKRIKLFSSQDISEMINSKLNNEFSIEGNLIETFREEWRNVTYQNIRALKSEMSIHSQLTAKTAKIFIFNLTHNNQAQSRHSISFEVIAFGDMEVQKLLNTSFSKIVNVFSSSTLKCKHIGETRIFIFPFNTNTNDIFSYDIKIRADIEKPINISKNEIFRWILMALILVACFFYNLNLVQDSDNKNIVLSILGSSLFYLITDIIIFIVVPAISQRGQRVVKINDLTSFVEAQENIIPENNNNQIQIPE